MISSEERFIKKKGIQPVKIMYMTKADRKTILHMENGDVIETFHPMKRLIDVMPAADFLVINKGIVVSPRYVKKVDNNVYFMTDGSSFHGRTRVSRKSDDDIKAEEITIQSWDEFQILNNMPLAFCIIELVFDENGHGMDFIFRYCNKEMETLEGKRMEEMIDHSFYEVFKDGDKKWLITYADVALNGESRMIESYSPEVNATLRIYCFQPKPNFCACALMKI